jgi:hypothetical protein
MPERFAAETAAFEAHQSAVKASMKAGGKPLTTSK